MKKSFQERMYLEVNKYNKEYRNAIKNLLKTKEINDVLSPLTALITQYIENCIKSYLQDFMEIKSSASKLNLNNHNLKDLILLCKNKYSLYTGMTEFSNPIGRLENYLDYLEKIYGENILINSRYPIESNTLRLSRKTIKVNEEEYKTMTKIMLLGIKELTIFYECEKLYSAASCGENSKDKLKNLLNEMLKDEDDLISNLYVGIIKQIDKNSKCLLDS